MTECVVDLDVSMAEAENMRTIITLCLALIVHSAICIAQPAEIVELRKKAVAGDADAQFEIGRLYYFGKYVSKDWKEATKWWHKAAEQGNVFGQTFLGFMYYNGEGEPKDLKEASKWWRLAAEQGNITAQTSIGMMYYSGKGVPKNIPESFKWFWKAAEQGDASSQHMIGLMYVLGTGVLKDEIEGLAWLNIAAIVGDPNFRKSRDVSEQRVGPQASLIAQKRSKEIMADVEMAKQQKAKVGFTRGG